MDVNERIKKQLESYPVLLYMKGTPDFPQCGFSARTVGVLREIGAKFAYVNIFEDPEIREGLKTYSNWRSEEHTSELQSRENLVCRLLLEKKKTHYSSRKT